MSDDITLAVADEEDALLTQEPETPTSFPDDQPATNADDPTFIPETELDEGAEVTS